MAKIVLDAVGGDHAPRDAVIGADLAIQRGTAHVEDLVLVGPRDVVARALREEHVKGDFAIVDAPDILTPEDSPTDAMRRKPKNSIVVGLQLIKEGKADAFISAGSTGTCVAAATVGLRCLEGIRRPAIGAIIHGEKGPFLVLDVGANPQPKPLHLAQYAIMGAAYYGGTFGVENPRVGILNIGSEELKGNTLVREARALLKGMPINFHGNVEGVEVFSGDCHVVVCDGFTGNVLLKVSEGVAEYVVRHMLGTMQHAGVEAPKIKQVLGEILPRIDFSEYGGALLLGIEGIVTICHGRSQAPAFANAIRFAQKAFAAQVNKHIVQAARSIAPSPSPEALG